MGGTGLEKFKFLTYLIGECRFTPVAVHVLSARERLTDVTWKIIPYFARHAPIYAVPIGAVYMFSLPIVHETFMTSVCYSAIIACVLLTTDTG